MCSGKKNKKLNFKTFKINLIDFLKILTTIFTCRQIKDYNNLSMIHKFKLIFLYHQAIVLRSTIKKNLQWIEALERVLVCNNCYCTCWYQKNMSRRQCKESTV